MNTYELCKVSIFYSQPILAPGPTIHFLNSVVPDYFLMIVEARRATKENARNAIHVY